MTDNTMTEKEVAFVNTMRDEINAMVDEKMLARTKTNPNVKRADVEKECETLFFKELGKSLEKEMNFYKSFFEFVEHENPQLLQRIAQSSPPISENITSFAEIINAPDVKLDNTVVSELNELGLKWFKKGEYDKAFHCYSFLCENQPANPDFWLLKGMSAHNLMNFEEAVASYLNTINIVPRYVYAYVELINCLIMAKEIDAAKEFFKSFTQEFHTSDYSDAQISSQVAKIKETLK